MSDPMSKLDKQTLTIEDFMGIAGNKQYRRPVDLPQFGTPEDSITLDDLRKMREPQTMPVSVTSTKEPIYVVNENNTHVRFKNTDGIVKVVKKSIIDYVEFDEDEGQATVFICDYDDEVINEKEFIKLCEALT